MTARKPFAAERRACNRILREVARLQRRYEPELRKFIQLGKYEEEMILRQRVFHEQARLYQDWIAIRRSMPPFVERRGRVDYLQLVTSENAHLLRPQYLVSSTSLPLLHEH